jgi:hypothetical protein
MTRSFVLTTLVLILLAGSCKKNIPAAKTDGGAGDSTAVPAVNGKKGACFNVGTPYGTFNGNVINLKTYWFYTWGTLVPVPSPQNCEFVSMFWGPGNMSDGNIAAVQQAKAQGTVKYVLGFNEPDRPDQANMTVSQALAYWPKLQSIGLPLGSPAPSTPTAQWFSDFMDSVKARNYRVDFICLHVYGGTDDNGFIQTLQSVYDKYHLPIWITEFAVADWNATSPANNQFSTSDVLGFMQRLLPRLESLSYVQRYSWFSGSPDSADLAPSALIATNGQLTALGSWYAGYQANTAIKP